MKDISPLVTNTEPPSPHQYRWRSDLPKLSVWATPLSAILLCQGRVSCLKTVRYRLEARRWRWEAEPRKSEAFYWSPTSRWGLKFFTPSPIDKINLIDLITLSALHHIVTPQLDVLVRFGQPSQCGAVIIANATTDKSHRSGGIMATSCSDGPSSCHFQVPTRRQTTILGRLAGLMAGPRPDRIRLACRAAGRMLGIKGFSSRSAV